MYRCAAGQDTPHHAADGAFHGLTVYGPGDVTGLDLVTDVQYPGEDTVRRGAEHALAGVAADEAGDVGVGQGAAFVDDAPQGVAAHGLHYRVAVLSGGEAGPDAYHHGGVGDAGAQIALGQYGVHQGIRVQLLTAQALRVGEDGYRTLRQQGQRLRRAVGADGPHALHCCLTVGDGRGEAHRPPYGGGAGQVGHDHLYPGAVQPQSDAGGNVACAAYQNKHS